MIFIEGSDAKDFLHRITAGRVKALAPGQGAAGLLLNGQSRMIAQFDLLCLAPKKYLLAAPAACAQALAEAVEALHFAEDLSIQAAGQGIVFERDAEGKREDVFPIGEGTTWPSPVPGYRCSLGASESIPDGFHFDRLGAGIPWPGQDWDANTPALDAGVLPAIDRFKGCYPGQEVVELSLNVGHPARVWMVAEGEAAPAEKASFASGPEALVLAKEEREGKWRFSLRAPWVQRANAPAGTKLLRGWE